jgi:hypothetical protein
MPIPPVLPLMADWMRLALLAPFLILLWLAAMLVPWQAEQAVGVVAV